MKAATKLELATLAIILTHGALLKHKLQTVNLIYSMVQSPS